MEEKETKICVTANVQMSCHHKHLCVLNIFDKIAPRAPEIFLSEIYVLLAGKIYPTAVGHSEGKKNLQKCFRNVHSEGNKNRTKRKGKRKRRRGDRGGRFAPSPVERLPPLSFSFLLSFSFRSFWFFFRIRKKKVQGVANGDELYFYRN